MSVLGTFTVLFEADSKSLEKGTKKTKKELTDVEKASAKAQKELEKTQKTIKKTGDSFFGASNIIKKFAGAMSLAAIAAGVFKVGQQVLELSILSSQLNISVSDLDAWGSAVARNGGSAAEFQSSIKNMNEKVQELALVIENDMSPAMRELGVNFLDSQGKAKNMMEILPELAKAFEKIDPSKAQALGARFGLDAGTIDLLRKGEQGVAELVAQQKKLGTVSAEDAEAAKEFQEEMHDLVRTFRSVFITIATDIIPVFTALFKGIKKVFDFIKENQVFVLTFFGVVGTAVLFLGKKFLIAGAQMLFGWLMGLAPIILLVAAIAAIGAIIALVVDDIVAFGKGNDSVIGRLIEKFQGFFDFLFKKFDFLKEKFKAVQEGFKKFVDFIGFGDEESDITQKTEVSVDSTKTNVNKMIAEGKLSVEQTSNVPLAATGNNGIGAASSTSNRSNQVNTGDIEIITQATDAEGISKALGEKLSDQLEQVVNDFDDGVSK